MNSALRDIAARFEHYRFFADEMRDGGGRVEVAVGAPDAPLDPEVAAMFRKLGILLVF